MSLLARLLPISDELTRAKDGIESTLREVKYSADRAAIVANLRAVALAADQAATKARDTARAIESGFGRLPIESPAPSPDTHLEVEDVLMVLMLVLPSRTDVAVLRSDIGGWTQAQRHEAEEWAAALHLKASDHEDVVVPPRPAFLPPEF